MIGEGLVTSKGLVTTKEPSLSPITSKEHAREERAPMLEKVIATVDALALMKPLAWFINSLGVVGVLWAISVMNGFRG